MGQNWTKVEEGGYFANPELSKKLRFSTQPMMKFRQYVRPEPGFGKGKGDTLDFDKIGNVLTRGGALSEFEKMPETKYQIRRGQLTITERGNSIPYTGKLEALSEFSITNPTQRALRDDMAKSQEVAVATEFKKTKVLYIPTGPASGTWDADGTASTQATSNLTVYHLKEIADALKTGIYGAALTINACPKYTGPDGDYIGIFSVRAARGIKDDSEWEEWNKYTTPDKLLAGEIGRIYGIRVIETNFTEALSNGVGANSVLGEAVIFGEDPVVEGVAIPEELRRKTGEDFGRDPAVAWYFLGGWKLTWDNPSVDLENRVVYVTSS